MRRPFRACLACAVAGLLLLACSPRPVPGPQTHPALAAGQYVLQPGDRIEVRPVLDGPYATVATVPPDGAVTIPGAGRVQVAGRTVPQVAAALAGQYRTGGVLNEPLVTVNLLNVGEQRVFVGGEVLRPGPVRLGGGARSVMQVIMARGGPMSTARLDDVTILRVTPDGGLQLVPVNLSQVLSGADLGQNALVQPMDVVIVPKSRIAQIDETVDQYIRRAVPIPVSAALLFSNSPSAAILP